MGNIILNFKNWDEPNGKIDFILGEVLLTLIFVAFLSLIAPIFIDCSPFDFFIRFWSCLFKCTIGLMLWIFLLIFFIILNLNSNQLCIIFSFLRKKLICLLIIFYIQKKYGIFRILCFWLSYNPDVIFQRKMLSDYI